MRSRRSLSLGLGLLFVFSALMNTAGVVLAQEERKVDAPRHCITGPGKPVQCFKTEAEALYTASGGKIVVAPDKTSASLSDAQLFSATSTVQATLYQDANYGGSTLTIYADSCSGWNNMATGWNDVVSSVRVGSCGITLFESYNLTGTSLHVNYPGTSYVGAAFNDKASSWSLP